MAKKKQTPKAIPAANANPALINPDMVEQNINYGSINYEPGFGWLAPKKLWELIRENRDRRRGG